MRYDILVGTFAAVLAGLSACGGGGASGQGSSGTTSAGGASGSCSGPGAAGSSASSGPGGGKPIDLCAGLVQDMQAHPMTPLAQPALGQTVTDAEFGTTIRRITKVALGGGSDPVIKPMYTTISAWNADESRLLL